MTDRSRWKKNTLAGLAALALVGTAVGARAEDMGKMDHDKTEKKAGKDTATETKKETKAGDKLEIAITDKGFEPNKLEVKKGQPVELIFTRKTDKTCIKEVVLDTGSSKIEKPLPLNTAVVIKTKFAKAGELKYACGMNMFTGTVMVR